MENLLTTQNNTVIIPEESLKLACLSLQGALPDLTPSLLKRVLQENYQNCRDEVELIDVHQAADLYDCCEMTIYRMVQQKKLKRYPIGKGRMFRINKHELMDFKGGY